MLSSFSLTVPSSLLFESTVLKFAEVPAQVRARSAASTGVPSDHFALSLNVYLTLSGSSETRSTEPSEPSCNSRFSS
ncbi:Uncharacterised protein [Mycobacteroides abscessus subsp. abscessus]|nr:Uncharacterised protein [Mycobacteroides abscessus subsp. abscessus]